MSGRIHITVDLEDRIREEIKNMESLPLFGAMSEAMYQQQVGRREALKWVLQMSRAELDE